MKFSSFSLVSISFHVISSILTDFGSITADMAPPRRGGPCQPCPAGPGKKNDSSQRGGCMSPWPGRPRKKNWPPLEGAFHVTMARPEARRRGVPCHHGRAGQQKKNWAAVRTPEKGPSMSPNLAAGPRKRNSADFSADFRISFHVTTS